MGYQWREWFWIWVSDSDGLSLTPKLFKITNSNTTHDIDWIDQYNTATRTKFTI